MNSVGVVHFSPQFTADARLPRVVFGAGSRTQLPGELELLGVESVMLLSTPGRARLVAELTPLLAGRVAGVFTEARQHVPAESLAVAREAAVRSGSAAYVAVGGGSALGYAKALAVESGAPIIAVPTTYSGSEVTSIWGTTDAGRKRTGRSPAALPRTVIYDPEPTLGFPPRLAGVSGMNAIAHCVEALYAPDVNPIVSLFATEGLQTMPRALRAICVKSDDLEARALALHASLFAGLALAGASMGPQHKLVHLLGGTFNLPHADVHAVLLPHVAAAMAEAPGMHAVEAALVTADASSTLYELLLDIAAPRSLRETGLSPADLDRAVALASESAETELQLSRDTVTTLLRRAFEGAPPLQP